MENGFLGNLADREIFVYGPFGPFSACFQRFNGILGSFKFFPDPEISHAGPAEKIRFREDIF